MKKLILTMLCVAILALAPVMASAYDINGDPGATIGYPTYATYGLNAVNYTPGINNGGIILNLFTNFPQAGVVCNGSPPWNTQPADVFITENYYGNNYSWAIPLVDRTGFTAGTMYAVASFLTSDQFDPSGGTGYIFNANVPVQVATVGNNYGWTSIGGGSVTWTALAGLPDYEVSVVTGAWQDDPFGTWTITWGTATCANDVLTGTIGGGGNPNVPIPPTALLLGSGLLGLAGLGWRRKGLKLAA